MKGKAHIKWKSPESRKLNQLKVIVMKQKITMELIAKAFGVKTFEITYCKNGVLGKCQGTERMVAMFRKKGIDIVSIQ